MRPVSKSSIWLPDLPQLLQDGIQVLFDKGRVRLDKRQISTQHLLLAGIAQLVGHEKDIDIP